ncbi:alpha-L-fucosidase [Parapedobacter defluvii]|uniref:alpha-L-fucosidase n=1 Tax=Parapedobacter defluvii TaxID=2045106 RepID=A0ABQ1L058_9SPHI|nr:alpha-L-fucosidase [Parapedobacter defluvii]GGC12553.1 alpha-L-fucosidase [Parapedobacter defluvii]
MKRINIGCFAIWFVCFNALGISAFAQTHSMSKAYHPPKDPLVQKKLADWQDLKFGLFMHWGTYSQWGVIESWTLCPEDESFISRGGAHGNNYVEYKESYENLQMTFNPVDFAPEKWVTAAKDAGMKYMIFTTKHHDGFCMFDTQETDYKITDASTPFSSNPRSNIADEIFKAFRTGGFMIGAYFSKPDWHNENYWWPYFPPKDRNPNYDPARYPERWQNFKNFTFNQIRELMTDYGRIDILWLDGGQVRPVEVAGKSGRDGSQYFNQDIDMPKIATMARALQPGLIMVDRTVAGEYENYTTPEQEVPDTPLPYPWETCMTIGGSWSYNPDDQFKSSLSLVQTLVKVVSRGGNLLLNIAPGPRGDWDPVAYERLKDIGNWMKVNSEGIYGSKPVAPYSVGNIYFTESENQSVIYAFWLSDKDEVSLPETLMIPLEKVAKKVKKVSLMGSDSALGWEQRADRIAVTVPHTLSAGNQIKYSAVFKIEF